MEYSDILSLIAIILSVIFSIMTLVLNRREKPNIMPDLFRVTDGNRLTLDFRNTSEINLHNLTILINGFDNNLSEIRDFHHKDKFLFSVGGKSVFNYGFNLGEYTQNKFYFRVRLKGSYITKYFIKRYMEEIFWYSGEPRRIDENGLMVQMNISHKDELDTLEAKFNERLRGYEKIIDKKFKN